MNQSPSGPFAPVPLKSVVETETKLSVEPDFRLPTLSGHPLPRRVFTSTYFDTLDHCLARSSITLRRRIENGSGTWQLKLPLDGRRREIELREASVTTPPARIVDALVVLLEGKHLVPIANLRTSRSGVSVPHGVNGRAEVVLDTVSVLREGMVIQQFRELEVESLKREDEFIDRLVSTLRGAGARTHDGRPKLFRALSLAYPSPNIPAANAAIEEHVRYSLLQQLQSLKQSDPGVRLGGEIEDVHQIRVAARRMRAILLAVRKIVRPEWGEPLLSGLKWLSEIFARARDLDVQMSYFRAEAEQLKVRDRRPLDRFLRHLQSERDKTQQTLVDEMKSARYLGFISKLREAAEVPLIVNAECTLTDVAARQFRKLRKAVRRLKRSPSNADLHGVRIKTKRARYAAELAEVCDGKPVTRFTKTAKQFQDLLGIHQDAVMAERYVQGLLKYQTGQQAAFTAGLLVARANQRREEVRNEFWSEWKRLRKRGQRAWC
ncbi:MAG TPA: CYTH and CHAD domain-containing protein [Nitrospira sp.]|nr:CYTH and CHAD domain-containing protein [Nitrospira sp.]